MKEIAKRAYHRLANISPTLYYNIKYKLAANKLSDRASVKQKLFGEFMAFCTENKKCMQIGVKEQAGAKLGSNWISVDKYDNRAFIDYHYDIQDLKFENDVFDAVTCISVLWSMFQIHKRQ